MAEDKTNRHRVVTSDAEIDRAIERAKRLKAEPRLIEVDYEPRPDLFVLKFSDGRRHAIPRENLQGLQSATKEQLARVEILGPGTVVHWPSLDVDFYVPGLLRGVYGNSQWMAKIGRVGGSARTAAKKKAARANGLKGGRPRRKVVAAGD
jgi:hypothetical protein